MTVINNENNLNFPAWLAPLRHQLQALAHDSQVRQGLLFHGSAGCGRLLLALWLARKLLGQPDRPCALTTDLEQGIGHPDFLGITRLEDKRSISIEQIRDLIDFLQLKSLRGGARVALIWPAEAMTRQAANSLLKTLEEPPDGATIMLIAESPGRLPATIVSRCQRLRINRPARAESVGWLNSIDTTPDWEVLLDFALDAPLVALDLHRKGFAAQAVRYGTDLQELRRRRITPLAIAQRWAAADAELLLRWLYRQLAAETAQEAAGLQNQMNQLNMRQALRQLRRIEEAYRNRDKALNRELQLTALLTDWYGATANPN